MIALSLEFFKLRRKRIFLMIILFLLAQMVWAFLSLSMSMSKNNVAHPQWEAVIAVIASMNGLFLPIISAIIVSRVCDMEHKGNTWKMIVTTNINRKQIYLAKYVCVLLLLLFYVILQTALIALFGLTNDFISPAPIILLGQYILGTMITSTTIVALQQWVSLSLKNQAFALCLGMVGGFIGMTADLFPAIIRQFFIWSYYTGLSPATYLFTENAATYISRPLDPFMLIIALILTAILYAAGSWRISSKEI
ncbi:ABC transporter permease [Paenibacillus fonticola]|uniref:ABC transporter permease n=1 Tax=Paenibacillus fonticola TaxID=379896 RepID=UPI00036E8C02|nr:ABC transporter permease [Paenibacillus fonticola]